MLILNKYLVNIKYFLNLIINYMTITRKRYRRKFCLKGGKKKKTIRKRKRKRQRGGSCGCAESLVGGRRRRKRKSRKRKSRKRKSRRKRRRRQRGGNLLAPATFKCNYPSNVGEIFTDVGVNLTQTLPDPITTNRNSKIVPRLKHNLKGGGFMDDFGLGDALLGYYKGTNAASNLPIRYKGGKPLQSADPMYQPGLLSNAAEYRTANVPEIYNKASSTAALNTIS